MVSSEAPNEVWDSSRAVRVAASGASSAGRTDGDVVVIGPGASVKQEGEGPVPQVTANVGCVLEAVGSHGNPSYERAIGLGEMGDVASRIAPGGAGGGSGVPDGPGPGEGEGGGGEGGGAVGELCDELAEGAVEDDL